MFLLASTVVEFPVKLALFALALLVHLTRSIKKHTVQLSRRLDSSHVMHV
jgi:hypothetical protein